MSIDAFTGQGITFNGWSNSNRWRMCCRCKHKTVKVRKKDGLVVPINVVWLQLFWTGLQILRSLSNIDRMQCSLSPGPE